MDVDEALDRLRTDASLRASVMASRAWGVSPGRFLGEVPARRLVLDGLGRPVRVEPEPEWTDNDRALALALVLLEADRCSGCGLPLTETTDAGNEGRYVADLPVRCHACNAIGERSGMYADDRHPQALRFGVHYHPPVTDADLEQLVDEQTGAAP